MKKTLIVLSGPSCVGKGPLRRALRDYHPEIQFAELVLCNSRRPRLKRGTNTYEVHGIEFYFLPRGLFEQLDRNRFVVANVRSDVQALDMMQVRELLEGHDLLLSEIHPNLGKSLIEWARRQTELDFEVKSVFLLPLSDEELQEMARARQQSPEQVVYEVMKAKLERRGEDPAPKMEERARSAFREMQEARYYSYTIVNHAGEDDLTEWSDPLGAEAQRVLDEFVKVVRPAEAT